MKQQNETFPTGLEAVFLIVGLYLAEYLVAGTLYDLKSFSGVDPRNLQGVIAVLGNGIMFSVLLHYKRMSYASLFHDSKTSAVATVAVLGLPILFIVPALFFAESAIQLLTEAIFPLSNGDQATFERMMGAGVASIITICILGPVLEEMLFRGIILRSFLGQYPRKAAIIGSATLFGMAHLNVYQFVVGATMGAVLGWLYERTRSLGPSILLHVAYNCVVMFAYANSRDVRSWEWPLGSMAVAIAFALGGTYLLRRLLAPRRVSHAGNKNGL